jgi:hypothetical protein
VAAKTAKTASAEAVEAEAARPLLKLGDRVRVITPDSPYTGCRGSVLEDPGARENLTPLGYYVAIDGENGRARPFLSQELQRLVAATARRRETGSERRQQA